jgi:hypothetical protein
MARHSHICLRRPFRHMKKKRGSFARALGPVGRSWSRLVVLVLLLIIMFVSPGDTISLNGGLSAVGIRPALPSLQAAKKQHDHIPTETNNPPFVSLKVNVEINGHWVPAVVDTGAQISIISRRCAKRCGIENLIDNSFKGKAVGVGSTDITGMIAGLTIRMGPASFSSRVAILETSKVGVDVLIGLDFLRKFRGEVSVKDNILRLQVSDRNIRIPFLNVASPFDSIDYSGHSEILEDDDVGTIADEEEEDTAHDHNMGRKLHNNYREYYLRDSKIKTGRLFGSPFVKDNSVRVNYLCSKKACNENEDDDYDNNDANSYEVEPPADDDASLSMEGV